MEKLPKKEQPEQTVNYTVEGIFETEDGGKFERRKYEYRDAAGEVQAEGVVELFEGEAAISEELADEKKNGIGRALKSFILRSKQAEEGSEEFDLMKVANSPGVNVIVADRPLKNYRYGDTSRCVTSPPLDSPFNIAILLHELGHAGQFEDGREAKKTGREESKVEKFLPAASWARDLKAGKLTADAKTVAANIKKIFEIDPDARLLIPPETFQAAIKKLRDIEGKIMKVENDKAGIKNEQDEKKEYQSYALIDVIGKGMKERFFPLDEMIERVKRELNEGGFDDETVMQDWKARLEAAGIFLSHQKKEAKEEEKEKHWRFGEERPEPPELGAEDIKNLHDIKTVLKTIRSLRYDESKINYEGGKRQMTVRFPLGLDIGDKFSANLLLDVEPEDFADFEVRISELEQETGELERKKSPIDEKIKNLESEYQKVLDELEGVIKLPVKVEERDATYRAMRWLTQLRDKSGIDFLHKEFIPPVGGTPKSDCGDSVRGGVHELLEKERPHKPRVILKKALGTYKAEHPPHTQSFWGKKVKK